MLDYTGMLFECGVYHDEYEINKLTEEDIVSLGDISKDSIRLVEQQYSKGVEISTEFGSIRVVSRKESSEAVHSRLISLLEDKEEFTKYASSLVSYLKVLNEDTQTGSVATKIDQSVKSKMEDKSKVPPKNSPIVGNIFKFKDGNFVVTDIVKDQVYLLGPDDEVYTLTKEAFANEVISDVTQEYGDD